MTLTDTIAPVLDRDARLARMRGRKPLTGSYPLILSDDAAERVRVAQERLLSAETDHTVAPSEETQALLAQARQECTAAHQALDGDTEVLLFEGLPRDVYNDLIEQHPPTEAQAAKAAERDEELRWNTDAFPYVLIHATNTQPGFDSPQHAQQMLRDAKCSDSEVKAIFGTALLTCEGAREVSDWGKGSGETAG